MSHHEGQGVSPAAMSTPTVDRAALIAEAERLERARTPGERLKVEYSTMCRTASGFNDALIKAEAEVTKLRTMIDTHLNITGYDDDGRENELADTVRHSRQNRQEAAEARVEVARLKTELDYTVRLREARSEEVTRLMALLQASKNVCSGHVLVNGKQPYQHYCGHCGKRLEAQR